MKKCILTLLVLCLNICVNAQEEEPWLEEASKPNANFFAIKRKYNELFKNEFEDPKSTKIIANSKNVRVIAETEYAKFRRWEWFQSLHVKPDGKFPTGYELKNEFEESLRFNSEHKDINSLKKASVNSAWANISRTSNSGGYHGMGLAMSAAFHPTNPNIFWVTSSCGGVWKTTDGGINYQPLSNNLPFLGTGSIIVDRLNADILYLCVGAFASSGATTNGVGVYKSINGGADWFPTGYTTSFDSQTTLNTIVQSPNNSQILLLATSSGLFRTVDEGLNWTLINSGNCGDVEFKLNDGNIVYATINDKLHRSTNSGSSFTLLDTASLPNNAGVYRINLTKANYNKILVWSYNSIWVSENDGLTWSQKNRPRNSPEDANPVGLDAMTLSPLDSNTMYGGQVNYFKSTDNGNSWQKIGNWCCGTPTIEEVHADHRHSNYNPLTNEIFSYNDGGVDKYNETDNRWTRLSNGLVIQQYYSSASAATNGNIIGVGSQDNGGALRQNNLNWINTNGGDAGTQAIDPNDSNICYSNYNPAPQIIRTVDGWGSTTEVSPNVPNITSWWQIPYTLDASDSNKIYVGYHAIFRSDDRGNNWTKISPDFVAVGDYWNAFRAIAVAPSNSNYIYAAGQGRILRYTANGGTTWNSYTFPQADISDIVVKDNNPQTLWVTLGQLSAGNKVFKSSNGGATWTNMSEGLPNVGTLTIVYQNNTNDMLFVGTDFGVYYRDANMNSWMKYGTELPSTTVTDLHIHYGTGKLRAATFGRGIYEISILDGLSVEETSIKDEKQIVYPNPTNADFTLRYYADNNIQLNLKLISMNGSTIYEQQANVNNGLNEIIITPRNIAPGIYFVAVFDQLGKKLFKQKIQIRN
jgi:photosystem II stability/assembly factor-like uncharacterized protein